MDFFCSVTIKGKTNCCSFELKNNKTTIKSPWHLVHDLCFPMTDDLPRLRFKCPFCTHTVKRRADLKRHLRCHTGERPYPCEACGKRFTRLEHLRNHFQTVRRLGGLWESAGFHWCHCSAVAGTSTITMSVL